MNKEALIAIAASATALAAAATALVSGETATPTNKRPEPSTDEAPQQEETPAPTTRRRGRPAAVAPAATEEATPEEEAPAKPAAPAKETGKTLDELRALIEPLVKAGQGDDVKKVITKYAAKLSEIEAKDHNAFQKDIEALSM